jgi:hypothetical protein
MKMHLIHFNTFHILAFIVKPDYTIRPTSARTALAGLIVYIYALILRLRFS